MVVAKVTKPGSTLIDFPATRPSARTLLHKLQFVRKFNSWTEKKIEKIRPPVSSFNALPTKITPQLSPAPPPQTVMCSQLKFV